MPDETTVTNETPAPVVHPAEVERQKLAANNAKLTEELKAERARNVRLLELAGADPKADPEKLAQAREADARARADRQARIDKAVTKGMLGMGRKLDDDQVDLILSGAQASKMIAVDESGVTGVDIYLAKFSGLFGATEPPKTETPKDSPRLPRQNAESNPNNMDALMTNLFQNVNNWQQLVKLGVEKKTEFEKRFPSRYLELQSAFSAKYSPSRR